MVVMRTRFWEHDFGVVANLEGVSAESRHILDDNHTYNPGFHICNHEVE